VSDDAKILEELQRTREDVQRWADYFENRFGSDPRPTDIGEIQKPLQALLEQHPIFSRNEQRWFGPKQLHTYPYQSAQQLLQRARKHDPKQALAWLHKVYTATTVDLRYIAEVHGIELEKEYALPNGVRVVRLEQLPASPMNDALKAQYQHHHFSLLSGFGPPPVVAIHEVHNVPATASYDGPHRSEVLERSVRAHAVASPHAAPVIGTSWIDLIDSDLEAAHFGRMWMSSFFDGPIHSAQSFPMDVEKLAKVGAYLKIKAPSSKACDIAAERLILARRRRSIANKAIEAAICLEALLLGESPNTEMTYRMGLRAALLLDKDPEKRLQIRKTVRKFYRIRGKVVHGGDAEDDATNRKIVNDGVDLCAQTLAAITAFGELPDWEAWELAGGNPAVQ
jgi:hypothetical protein